MSTPVLNINLNGPCTCATGRESGGRHHFETCKAAPVLIPCPIPRSVTFEVVLSNDPPEYTSGGEREAWCKPISVSCSISGKTWAESEPNNVEGPSGAPVDLITVCRERWGFVKSLLLGHSLSDCPQEVQNMRAQRDTVFSALADMAQAEQDACNAQQRVDEAFPSARYAKPGDTDHRAERPSVNRLARYVEHLIEQVGVL